MLFVDYYRLISVVHPQIQSVTGKIWDVPEFLE
jgi:hypothetical protein